MPHDYYIEAQGIFTKCTQLVIDSCELVVTPISTPADNVLEKAGAAIGSVANKWLRAWRESQLKDAKGEARKLYGRYAGVFKRANCLAAEKGAKPVDLSACKFGAAPTINNSLENDDWDTEFQKFADTITEFIDKTCEAADELIRILEGRPDLFVREE